MSTRHPPSTRQLFGWEADDVVDARFGGYRVFRLDGRRVGGIGMNTAEDPGPPHWGVFLLTFNAATTSELIGEAGGTVLFEPMVVPTRGVIGMAIDATGAVVGYWQPAVVEGFDVFGEIGGAVWFELNASDFDAAERFYAHAFDWSIVRNDEEPRRAVFERGGRNLAGIVDASRMLRTRRGPVVERGVRGRRRRRRRGAGRRRRSDPRAAPVGPADGSPRRTGRPDGCALPRGIRRGTLITEEPKPGALARLAALAVRHASGPAGVRAPASWTRCWGRAGTR